MAEKIVEVKGLSFAYSEEDPKVLSDVTFSVDKGSYVAIIGHNGSGKSTLARILLGLLDGYSGEVSEFGERLDKKSLTRLRSRIGIVFQNPDNQFVGSTVADDIAFGLENKCVPSEKMQGIIERYAEYAGMKDFLSREPTSLSGGQKQRVAIAGVLAMEPDLVIFDESTAMLDPKGKKEIASLISKVKSTKPDLTIISITHDIEEAATSDEVIVLNKGKIVLQGKPEEVFSHEKELSDCHLDVPFAYALENSLTRLGVKHTDSKDPSVLLEDLLCR